MTSPAPMPDSRIEELQALAEKATPGPWGVYNLDEYDPDVPPDPPSWWVWQESRKPFYGGILDIGTRSVGDVPGAIGEAKIADHVETDLERADAEFIAAARTAVPDLLAEVKRLRANEARVRGLHRPEPYLRSVPVFDEFDEPWERGTKCAQCAGYVWPCAEIRMLDGAE